MNLVRFRDLQVVFIAWNFFHTGVIKIVAKPVIYKYMYTLNTLIDCSLLLFLSQLPDLKLREDLKILQIAWKREWKRPRKRWRVNNKTNLTFLRVYNFFLFFHLSTYLCNHGLTSYPLDLQCLVFVCRRQANTVLTEEGGK